MTIRSILALLFGLAALGCVAVAGLITRQMLVANGEEVERARVARVLAGLAAATETNLAVGLSLDNLGMLQPQLERERSADQRLLALDIFAIGGRSAFSTDRGAVGELVPDSWIAAARADMAGIWRVEERGEIAYGRTVSNDIGLPVAGIAVTLSAAEKARTTEQITLRLATIAVPIALLAAGLAGGAGALLGRGVEGRFARMVAQLSAAPLSAAHETGPARMPCEDEAAAARRALADAQERRALALRRLESLDDAG